MIEKDIPIPKPSRGDGKFHGTKFTRSPAMQLAAQMDVGDSMLFKSYTALQHVRAKALDQIGKRAVSRKIPGQGWRLWRVE
jgi:hypothetical protein